MTFTQPLGNFFRKNALCRNFASLLSFIISMLYYSRGLHVNFKHRRAGGTTRSEKRRFELYCLYAYGLPIVVITAAFLVDEYATLIPDDLRIRMGAERCWINPLPKAELFYVYILMSIVVLVNVIFFATTAYKIYRVQKETAIITGSDSGRHSSVNMEKDRYV